MQVYGWETVPVTVGPAQALCKVPIGEQFQALVAGREGPAGLANPCLAYVRQCRDGPLRLLLGHPEAQNADTVRQNEACSRQHVEHLSMTAGRVGWIKGLMNAPPVICPALPRLLSADKSREPKRGYSPGQEQAAAVGAGAGVADAVGQGCDQGVEVGDHEVPWISAGPMRRALCRSALETVGSMGVFRPPGSALAPMRTTPSSAAAVSLGLEAAEEQLLHVIRVRGGDPGFPDRLGRRLAGGPAVGRVVDDPAVWAPIHRIAGTLDKAFPELLAPDYDQRLECARRRFRPEH
ncbi:hypothetical protein Slala03_80410 [Streptomyces lavendulae subsp. lavendulae]|nr:hypothetical protein Slala03_80410 [Streptomyces lavendulae subsp. lavendulae]